MLRGQGLEKLRFLGFVVLGTCAFGRAKLSDSVSGVKMGVRNARQTVRKARQSVVKVCVKRAKRAAKRAQSAPNCGSENVIPLFLQINLDSGLPVWYDFPGLVSQVFTSGRRLPPIRIEPESNVKQMLLTVC
jgi:hypothetical protein